jgi:hypothetical protein
MHGILQRKIQMNAPKKISKNGDNSLKMKKSSWMNNQRVKLMPKTFTLDFFI